MTDPHGFDRGLTNYGDRDFARFLRRSFARSMGLSSEMLSKPVVGIAMTPSEFNNCHRHMPELVEAVSRGVLAAGALPRAFPTTSLGEIFLHPTSMMFRNLMAIDTEEMVRAQPMDAVVLIGGCDKTIPAQLMGAASANVPAIQLAVGPMMTGRHRGQRLGACTDCRSFWARYRGGGVGADEICDRRAAPCGDDRHLRGDGYGQHHGLHCRDARHVPARHRGDPRGAFGAAACGRGKRQGRRRADRQARYGRTRSSRRNRSRTRFAC